MGEYWTTLKEALGVTRYIIVGRSAAAAALLVGAYSYLSSLLPTWLPPLSWLAFFLIVFLGTLTLTLFSYAHTLRLGKRPRVRVSGLSLYDDQGWHRVRLKVKNEASDQTHGLKAQVDKISDPDGALGKGKVIDFTGEHIRLDYPIQLASFDLLPAEERSVEIFRLAHEYGSWSMYVGNHPLITPPQVIF